MTGGGVSTFYTSNSDPSAFITALQFFYSSMSLRFPPSVTITAQPAGETIEVESGAINGAWAFTPPAAVNGTGSTSYAAGVGARVTWNTTAITRRRRVKGSTYLVPVVGTAYDTDGTLSSATVTAIQGAASTLIAADGGSMRVYTRPQTVESNDGAAHAVTSATAIDRVSWLRSRRT